MGLKSITVPQPKFSQWVINRRQELNLSQTELRYKIGSQVSERTLKYFEDSRKDSFSEYSLNALAKGLELNYAELLNQIVALQTNSPQNGNGAHTDGMTFPVNTALKENPKILKHRSALLAVLSVVFLCLLLFGTNGVIFNKDQGLSQASFFSPGNHHIQNVLIHSEFPQMIITFDEWGNRRWQKHLKNRVQKVALFDLDQDGSKEVLAATIKLDSRDQGKHPGVLCVWNEQGDLLTEYNTWQPSIYPVQEPRANVSDFQITDLENDGIPDIVTAIRGEQYYPSRLAVFHYQNAAFTEVKTFWNPGYLLKLFIEDLNGDGFPEILCTGVNNDFKRVSEFQLNDNVYSIFMLDGRKISGQAPPYLGDAQPGSQLWYRYVAPPSSNVNSAIEDVTFLGEREKEVHVKLGDTCFFYLNYAGEIVGQFDGDQCLWETSLHRVAKGKAWQQDRLLN